jgi:hypothetical protein
VHMGVTLRVRGKVCGYKIYAHTEMVITWRWLEEGAYAERWLEEGAYTTTEDLQVPSQGHITSSPSRCTRVCPSQHTCRRSAHPSAQPGIASSTLE